MSQNTLEYRTMLKCTSVSETAVKDHLTVIAGELLAASIISPENASALRNPAIDTEVRAARLIELVTNKVKLSTSVYYIFVEVLIKRREDNRIILELLEHTYKDLSDSEGEEDEAGPGMQHSKRLPVSDKLSFSDRMSKTDFKKWLSSIGLEKKEDHHILHDVGVNAKCLAHLDKASIEAIASKLSLGGKGVFMDVCKKIKETGKQITTKSAATEHSASNGSLEVSADGTGSKSHQDKSFVSWLKKKDEALQRKFRAQMKKEELALKKLGEFLTMH